MVVNLARYIRSALAIAEMEARKIKHDSTEMWMRAIQPTLWLLVFGEVLQKVRGLAPNGIPYLEYITPGILAQSVLFVSVFYGITLVWERDVGILTKLLSTPAPRSSIVFGKALASSVRGLFQGVVIFLLALAIGIHIHFYVYDVLGVFAVIIILALVFSSMSMILASLLRTRDRMMGIGQAITMPLFFASNAIYPLSLMPHWIQVIAEVNPLSYAVEAMRSMLITGDNIGLPLDFLILIGYSIAMLAIASITIRRLS